MKTQTNSRIVRITPEMINAFRKGTGDTNEIHHEHALGYQLEMLHKDVFEEEERETALPTYIKTRFKKLVPAGSNLQINIERNGTKAKVLGMVNDELALETLIELGRRMPFELPQKYVATGYPLKEQDALLAAKGLGKEEPDYLALAVGLSSRALLEFSRLKPVPEGKAAVYISHELCMEPEEIGSGLLLLKVGQERRRILVKASYKKEDEDSKLIYTAKLTLFYADKDSIA